MCVCWWWRYNLEGLPSPPPSCVSSARLRKVCEQSTKGPVQWSGGCVEPSGPASWSPFPRKCSSL